MRVKINRVFLIIIFLSSCEDLFLRFKYETYECPSNIFDIEKIVLMNQNIGDFGEININNKNYKVKILESSKDQILLSNTNQKLKIDINKQNSQIIVNQNRNITKLNCKKHLFKM